MKAFELVGEYSEQLHHAGGFTIGNSKVVWESAVYSDRAHKIIATRVVESGGRPFMMGLFYKTRYVNPESEVTLVTVPS